MSRDPKSSLISSYIKGRSYPSFEIVLKLIELGITDEELLGKKHAEMLRFNSKISPEEAKSIFDSPKFREEVEKILSEIQEHGNVPTDPGSVNILDKKIEGNSPTGNM